jgi:nucleotidyltransferase AbiEii toxin of type IV toxin-antitoxin system
MLDPRDLRATAATFGVAEAQVRRDHLIGHTLAALADLDLPDLVFLGGTALSWTHLSQGRLSEDIDLMTSERRSAASTIEGQIPRHLRREFPGSSWDPGLLDVRSVSPARLVTPDGLVVRIQLLDAERQGWHDLPTEQRTLVRRYRDVPETVLRVPTLAAFAAMKALAWVDRHAARDLYDLAGLATIGALTKDAAGLFDAATGRPLAAHDFARLPADWDTALRHQTGDLPSARECLDAVRDGFAESLGARWQPA